MRDETMHPLARGYLHLFVPFHLPRGCIVFLLLPNVSQLCADSFTVGTLLSNFAARATPKPRTTTCEFLPAFTFQGLRLILLSFRHGRDFEGSRLSVQARFYVFFFSFNDVSANIVCRVVVGSQPAKRSLAFRPRCGRWRTR